MERPHGIRTKAKEEVKAKVREKGKEKVKVKVERKEEKEKENGISRINHHMGETPTCHMGETPIRTTGGSCKENVETGYCMVTAIAALIVPWTTIQTAEEREKAISQKAKVMEKKKEMEESRANMEASLPEKKANLEPIKELGLQQVGELSLAPRLKVQQIVLHANFI